MQTPRLRASAHRSLAAGFALLWLLCLMLVACGGGGSAGSGGTASAAAGAGGSSAGPVPTAAVAFGNVTKTYGDGDFTLDPPAGSSGSVSFTSTASTVASIAGNTVHIVGAGTATINAVDASGVTIAQATLNVGLAKPNLVMPSTVTLQAMTGPYPFPATSNSDGAITYSLSNTSIARVVAGGISGRAAGSGTITATQAATPNYEAATVTATLTVNKQDTFIGLYDVNQTFSGFLVIPAQFDTQDLFTGEIRTPTITIDPGFAALAGFDQSGWDGASILLLPKRTGTAMLTMSVPATTNLAAATKTVSITLTEVTNQQPGRQLASISDGFSATDPLHYQFDSATNTITLKACSTYIAQPGQTVAGQGGTTATARFAFTNSSTNGVARHIFVDGVGQLSQNPDFTYTLTLPNTPITTTLRSVVDQYNGPGGVSFLSKEFDYTIKVQVFNSNDPSSPPGCAPVLVL